MIFLQPGQSPPQYHPSQQQGRTTPLIISASAPFVDGRAELYMGPERAGQSWHVTRLVTAGGRSDENILLYVYRNSESPANLLDSSTEGGQSTSETDISLLEGERLMFVWTGGTGGATMNITGEIKY